MCGYCSEGILIETLNASWRAGDRFDMAYLYSSNLPSVVFQETPQPVVDLKYLDEANLENSDISRRVLHCRAIESLFDDDAVSSAAIISAISEEDWWCDLPDSNPAADAFRIMSIRILRHLFSRDTFLAENWLEVLHAKGLAEECRRVIDVYCDTWLRKENEQEGLPDEVLNPKRQQVPDILTPAFPAIYFAVLFLGRAGEGGSLQRLLVRDPINTPFFDGLDLWLQRLVARELFRMFGINYFIPYNAALRPAILPYLAWKFDMELEERQQLGTSLRDVTGCRYAEEVAAYELLV